jgi:hypothetical protein
MINWNNYVIKLTHIALIRTGTDTALIAISN